MKIYLHFFLVFCSLIGLSRPDSIDEAEMKAFTIPAALNGASVQMVMETSPCSATCGMGKKVEKRCTVDKKVHDCVYVTVECVISHLCDMHTYTLADGDNITMSCLEKGDFIGNKSDDLVFHWKIARGMLTKEEDQFDRLLGVGSTKQKTITLTNIQEVNAGTYLCDIQTKSNNQIVKRIYHGVKVVPPRLSNLNYDKFLAQKKEEDKKKLMLPQLTADRTTSHNIWWLIMLGVGFGVGIVAGLIIMIIRRCLARLRKPDIEENI